MNWKTEQLRRESNKESVYCNLTLDSIGWFIPKYHSDKILRDMLFNLTKKVYLSENQNYIMKLNALPDSYDVAEKIEELENMFTILERRMNK